MCYRVCKYFCNFVVPCLPFRFCSAAWQQTLWPCVIDLLLRTLGQG